MIENVYKKIYKDIELISIAQGNKGYDILPIQKGGWTLLLEKDNIFLFNPFFVSQVYSDRKFDLYGKNLEIHFNKTKRFKNEDKSNPYKNVKVYDNGILFLDDLKIYPSAYFDNLCGLMLINE